MANKVLRSLSKAIKPVKRLFKPKKAVAVAEIPEISPSPTLPVLEVGDAFEFDLESITFAFADSGDAKTSSSEAQTPSLDELAREEAAFLDAPSTDCLSKVFPPTNSVSSSIISSSISESLREEVAQVLSQFPEPGASTDTSQGTYGENYDSSFPPYYPARPSAPSPALIFSYPSVACSQDYQSDAGCEAFRLGEDDISFHSPPLRPSAPSPPSILSSTSIASRDSLKYDDELYNSSPVPMYPPRPSAPSPPSTQSSSGSMVTYSTYSIDLPPNSSVEFVPFNSVARLAWDYHLQNENLTETVCTQRQEIAQLKLNNALLTKRLKKTERLYHQVLSTIRGPTSRENSSESSFDKTLVSLPPASQVNTIAFPCVSPKAYIQPDWPLNALEPSPLPKPPLDLDISTPRLRASSAPPLSAKTRHSLAPAVSEPNFATHLINKQVYLANFS